MLTLKPGKKLASPFRGRLFAASLLTLCVLAAAVWYLTISSAPMADPELPYLGPYCQAVLLDLKDVRTIVVEEATKRGGRLPKFDSDNPPEWFVQARIAFRSACHFYVPKEVSGLKLSDLQENAIIVKVSDPPAGCRATAETLVPSVTFRGIPGRDFDRGSK